MTNDITFCMNQECPLAKTCRRADTLEAKFVSMARFEFVTDEHGTTCENYKEARE